MSEAEIMLVNISGISEESVVRSVTVRPEVGWLVTPLVWSGAM